MSVLKLNDCDMVLANAPILSTKIFDVKLFAIDLAADSMLDANVLGENCCAANLRDPKVRSMFEAKLVSCVAIFPNVANLAEIAFATNGCDTSFDTEMILAVNGFSNIALIKVLAKISEAFGMLKLNIACNVANLLVVNCTKSLELNNTPSCWVSCLSRANARNNLKAKLLTLGIDLKNEVNLVTVARASKFNNEGLCPMKVVVT